jgi:hypothetical protein
MERPHSLIRAFKQRVERAASLPGGGGVYKIDMRDLNLPPDVNLQDFRLFVAGNWSGVGLGGTTVCYTYFAYGEWYLYEALGYYKSLQINVIAVPKNIESDDYADAIFEHTAIRENTGIPANDHVTGPEFRYATWMDDPRLNGRSDLMLIVSRHAEGRMVDPYTDSHHHAVWYDANRKGKEGTLGVWAILYPSRNAISQGAKFNVMAMKPYEEHEGMMEYIPSAFAFRHLVDPANTHDMSINTTNLDRNQAEYLLEEIDEWNRCFLDKPKIRPKPEELIVIPTEVMPDLVDVAGNFRPATEVNLGTLNVWYVAEDYVDASQGKKPINNLLWTVFVAENANIKPITINICTRTPCPPCP